MDGRRAWAVVAVVLIGTGLAACGGKSEQAQAQELILGASEATFAAGTAQVLLELGDADGEGQVDFENGQSAVSVPLDAGDTTVTVDGSDVFVTVGDDVTLLDVDQLDVLGNLQQVLIALAPGALVHLLDGLDGDVVIVGDDDIDGVDATHYSLTVDVDAVLDELDGDTRDLLAILLAALGHDSLDIDVWLDDDGRLVQFQADFDLGGDDPVTVTVGLRDFGSDVEIRVPRTEEALSPADFQLATADVSGRWDVESAITSTTNETAQPSGPEQGGSLNLRCDASGACTNSVSGSTWEPSGAGEFTVDQEIRTDCTDNASGTLVLADSAVITSHTTWTVTEVDDRGRAVALTSSGTIEGQVTAAGQARNCPFVGGGFTYTAAREGSATRR
jgi:hypothetical protein